MRELHSGALIMQYPLIGTISFLFIYIESIIAFSVCQILVVVSINMLEFRVFEKPVC